MPLAGGPADKAGNSYERRWTVFSLLDVLSGDAEALRIEVPGEEGIGSEFRLMVGGVAAWHQAKRQRAAGPWTLNALISEGVLPPWQAALGRGERCVFVCSTGADDLRELADRARDAESWEEFDNAFLSSIKERARFERLRRAWPNMTDQMIFAALKRVTVRSIGEPELADWINDRLRTLVTGAEPLTAAAVMAQLVDDAVHHELTAVEVWGHLARHGVTPRALDRDASVVQRVADCADAFFARLRPLYIGGSELGRPEADTALRNLDDGRRTILAGAAGSGKSVVAAQVAATARQRSWSVLVVSADRLPDATTTTQLGKELGFPDSPVTVLAGVAAGDNALLVIDQLDALSVTSGRHPERLGLVSDLLREARSHPKVRVLLACRQFDIDNDRALRAAAHDDDTTIVPVGALDGEQMRQALTAAGLPSNVPVPLVPLLAVPLHLALYVELAVGGATHLASVRTLTQLYDRFWGMKRAACRMARSGVDEWHPVIERLVQRMNDCQELSVPEPVADNFDQQVKIMASEGVVAVGEGRVTFFHETFFDYCFARQFLGSGDSLRGLLARSEQDLFRRAQVRQILAYERGAVGTAYLADLGWLVASPDVRVHIKALVVALLETVANPTAQEWELLRGIAEDPESPLHLRLWQAVRNNPGWFTILDADGTWDRMLRKGGAPADRAVWALAGSAAEHAARIRGILTAASPEVWPSRRRWFLRLTDVHRARDLVDLMITAIDEGDFESLDFDFAHTIRQLAEAQPTWGVEVLAAYLRRGAAQDAANPFDPSRRLGEAGRDLTDEVSAVAVAAPSHYIESVLPLLLETMRPNARPDWQITELVQDALWSHRVYRGRLSLSDDVYDAMGLALAKLAEQDPVCADGVFAVLRAEPYESAAFLLARGYAGNPTALADEAVDWLVGTPGALLLGYSDAPTWISRKLILAVSRHCSAERLDRLAEALLHYTTRYERTYRGLKARGYTELGLLNAIYPTRRSVRVARRLAELRRKFNIADVASPQGVTGGFVPPPISEDRARRMSDRHWLAAMKRYGVSESTACRDGEMVGDAWTQAQVLESLTKEDPQRFARLLLRITEGIAEAYPSAILSGLAESPIDDELLLEVCRHVRALGGSDASRWLVRLIEQHAPGRLDSELVSMVASVAVSDPDPASGPPDEPWNGGSIDSAALNSTRGAAALAICNLLTEDAARLPLLEPALRQLVVDSQIEVRAAAVAALAPLLDTHTELAFALFDGAVSHGAEELLGSRYVAHFLRHAVRRGHYARVADQLSQALHSASDDARAVAARLITLAAYYDNSIDDEVDAILAGDDEGARAAAIRVIADSITYVPRRHRTIAVLSTALYDSAKSVRDAAGRGFYGLRDESLTEYETLITAFAGSPALADGGASALNTLESSRCPLPAAALDVCEAFVAAHKNDIGDISTGAAGDAMYVVRLTLRMHAQHDDPQIRRRCLDLIDQLVVLRAHNIESDLETLER